MNSYNIYNSEDEINHIISYHAVANDENQVKELALQQGIDLTGYTIELMRHNVKNELHKDYSPYFESCQP